MKKCPACSVELDEDVGKCPACGYVFGGAAAAKPKWYYSTFGMVLAFLVLGPLAVPLVWLHPRYTIKTKVVITAVMVALTVWGCLAIRDIYVDLMEQIESLDL